MASLVWSSISYLKDSKDSALTLHVSGSYDNPMCYALKISREFSVCVLYFNNNNNSSNSSSNNSNDKKLPFLTIYIIHQLSLFVQRGKRKR